MMGNVISVDYRIYEPEVGILTHDYFNFGNSGEDKNEIKIWKANDISAFGTVVFEGNLKDLIERLMEWPGVTA